MKSGAKMVLAVLASATALAGCGRASDEPGMTVSIDAKGDNGADVAIKADKDGRVAIDIPGFEANLKVPKMLLDNGDFDIDGVKLYPGSKMASVNVDADDRDGAKRATVKIGFTSPAEPAKVRDWFAKAFADNSMTVAASGTGLSGKTRDGDDFTMAFAPVAGGQTSGTVTIVDTGR